MQCRSFGRHGVKNTHFVFGTMQFGGGADAEESAAIYALCREAGVSVFDTAYAYTEGESERILGQLIKHEREQTILATKVAASGGSGAANVTAQFEECLRRLDTDYVDILFLHRWDAETPLEETFEALARFHAAGRFQHLGVSNWSAWQVMKGQAIAAREGFPRIDVLQPMYNLVKRQVEVEILPMALSEDIAVVSYSPLGGGLLTGKYSGKDTAGRLTENQMYKRRYGPGWMHKAAAGLADLARDHGMHPATLAVAWTMRHPGITAPIIGSKSVEQLRPALAAQKVTLSDALVAEIEALVPTPPPATDRLEEQRG